MKRVLDASAALEVALNRDGMPRLRLLLEEASEILAPELLLAEAVNGLWKEHRFGGLPLAICDEALELLPSLVHTWVPLEVLYREAFVLSRANGLPANDMFYLALALREDALLVTMDKTLKKEARRVGVRVA